MESVNKRVIIIALIMALITSFLVFTYISNLSTPKDTVEYANVYVAAKTMEAKYKITEADLKQQKIPREYLNPKVMMNKTDIVGKRLKVSIIEGEQILKERLVDESNMELAYNIPEGKRAVSVNVNEQIEVANLIRKGDFVDVIASYDKVEYEDKLTKTIYPQITKTIIQNIEILALGKEQGPPDEKLKDLPKTVTLAVTPQDMEKLVFASEFAIIRLALRQVDDNKIIDTSGAIRSDMIPDKGVRVQIK